MVKRTTVVAIHKKPEERSDSKFKGVRKRKWGRWVSEIRLPNSRERIWLGSYDSAEKAARAFDAALFCLRGTTARFNFPDNPPKISGGQSLSPPEIQVAAEKFAKSGAHLERQPEPSEPEPEPKPERQHPVGSPSHSPSPSLSEGSSITDVSLDGSFLDLLTSTGSGDGEPDLGMFPGLDEFPSDFYGMPFPSTECCGEENIDELLAQDNFLWSF